MIEVRVPGTYWSYWAKWYPATSSKKYVERKSVKKPVLNWMKEQGIPESAIRWSERPEPFIQFEDDAHAVLFTLTFGTK